MQAKTMFLDCPAYRPRLAADWSAPLVAHRLDPVTPGMDTGTWLVRPDGKQAGTSQTYSQNCEYCNERHQESLFRQ